MFIIHFPRIPCGLKGVAGLEAVVLQLAATPHQPLAFFKEINLIFLGLTL
jgi:hypothetical protein